ncbi:MAG: GNAT family N-acetyltransferase [Anaerolineae bacterium]|nr:GNAT family N-acetyltransferase [Anaerolineae bacterium]
MDQVRLLSVKDHSMWDALLPSEVSVFGCADYAQIWEESTGHTGHLFVLGSEDACVLYPFSLRPISALPFACASAAPAWDIRTPDYTGPVVYGSSPFPLDIDFARQFSEFCQERNIVAEFAHLHPWLPQDRLLDPDSIAFDREIVYVDLTLSEDELWQDSFTYACRKNIRRSQREQVRVFPAETADDIGEFYRLYVQTMDRVQALERYYLPLEVFTAFFGRMPDNARFALASYHDRVVAATLYLHDRDTVYSYLGGADYDYQQVRPTNALIYETIRWAIRQGKKRMVLGGGYRPQDGVFRFKASFSPLRARFHVYKHIHLPSAYARLCRDWSAYYGSALDPDGYFPAYRSVAPRER